jgi:iron complex transport system permease protein
MTMTKKIFIGLILFTVMSWVIGLSLGSVHINLFTVIKNSFHANAKGTDYHDMSQIILFQLRLPRIACAFIIGGLLSLSGALMQTLLRNPLADPYVLGISGGAAAATLLGLLWNISILPLPILSFAGSLVAMFLVILLAQHKGFDSPIRLLLIGVVTASGWSAIISFILTISPDKNLHGMLFWLMGDLSYVQFSIIPLIILILGFIFSLYVAKPLNIICQGTSIAQIRGIHHRRLYGMLYIISALLTATAVSMAGCIGFIGLIVPHALRLIGTSDHRFVLPASVLLGGSYLVLADTVSRIVLSPMQLPVGIVTAIIGVPSFLLLLRRSQ